MTEMNIKAMRRAGDLWQVTLEDTQGRLHPRCAKRLPGETLADAAVRLEEMLLDVQKGLVKPLNLVA